MDPLCLSFPARGHSLQDASITEPRTWASLVGKAPQWPPHWFLLLTGCSSSPPTKAVFKGAAFVEGIDEMYSLWSNTIFHYALWFFIVFLIMIFFWFYFSLTFAHFNPRSSLALYVFVSCLLSLPPLFLGYSIARIYPVIWLMSMR